MCSIKIVKAIPWLIRQIDFEDEVWSNRLLEAIGAIGGLEAVKSLKQLIRGHQNKKLLFKWDNQLYRDIESLIRHLQNQTFKDAYGGLSMVEDNKSGSLSVAANHDKSSSLNIQD